MTGFVGTPQWMAPEALRGEGDYGKPADVYSLSLVLWEILHEKIPFANLSPPQVIAQVAFQHKTETIDPNKTPQRIHTLMQNCWAQALQRPNAADFVHELENFAAYAAPRYESSPFAPSAPPMTSPPTNQIPAQNPHYPLEVTSSSESKSMTSSSEEPTPVQSKKSKKTKVPDFAFGAEKWKKFFGDVGEEPELPKELDKILNGHTPFEFYRDKTYWGPKYFQGKVKDSHFLFLMPETLDGKPFTLKLLMQLIQKSERGPFMSISPLDVKEGSYKHEAPRDKFSKKVIKSYQKKKVVENSYWVLMSKHSVTFLGTVEGKSQKIYQYEDYDAPNLLEATTGICLYPFMNGERIFEYEYTPCKDRITTMVIKKGKKPKKKSLFTCVGGFDQKGPKIGVADFKRGVWKETEMAAVRRLNRKSRAIDYPTDWKKGHWEDKEEHQAEVELKKISKTLELS